MQPTKRKRTSGLTGIELAIALAALKKLAEKARQELIMNAMQPVAEEQDPELELVEEAEATVLTQIKELMAVLQARADGPQGMTGELLEDLKIQFSGTLALKGDAPGRGALTDNLGNDKLWSATTLLAHLRFLEELVPRCNAAARRLWINAFFYRVSAMIPEHLKMAVSIEQVVPAVTLSDKSPHTLSGFIDFTAAVMVPAQLERPVLWPNDSVLFVSEAKDVSIDLKKHIPQAVAEMLGCARRVGKKIVKGVVTDGRSWIFLILTLQGDGTATYVRSAEINDYEPFTTRPSQEGVSLISAILAHWILHSHEAFNESTDFFLAPI
ncbi:hypothetical protein NLJ89_g8764 [Agrocybe chaxingu]|uniref:Uncharacterized protein n=1 Tax=Agrocybe chaxingu TaxID=84603 RepID=A0A9W8JS23_9AGAR|nr:hypothetical protein NLJ89_g8764 [Agrocybe chaxingu]